MLDRERVGEEARPSARVIAVEVEGGVGDDEGADESQAGAGPELGPLPA